MAITSSPCDDARAEWLEARFRDDVAGQLEELGRAIAPAPLTFHVSASAEAAVLEIASAAEDALCRVVVRFNDDEAQQERWLSWLTVKIETPDATYDLLTLAWTDEAQVEERADDSLPSTARGLNAAAPFREGRYARGNPLRLLQADLLAALKGAGFREARAIVKRPPAPGPSPPASLVAPSHVASDQPPPDPIQLSPLPGAAAVEEPPPELARSLAGFREFLALHTPAAGLRRGEVIAFVQESLREDFADKASLAEARSQGTEIQLLLKGLTPVLALLVAYGAEVMTSGFAFGDMIFADWLNWPLAFASAFLFGGGLLALAKDEEKPFWNRVAVAWVMTVSILAVKNETLVDPVQDKFGVERQVAIDARDAMLRARALLSDLDQELGRKRASLERDKERYSAAKKDRPSAMLTSAEALKTAEAARKAAFGASSEATRTWDLVKTSDPSHWKAEIVVFFLTLFLNGAGTLYIAKYWNSRDEAHKEALGSSQRRWRLRHESASFRDSGKSQEARAFKLVAQMRAAYAGSLERRALAADEIQAQLAESFGVSDEETAALVKQATRGFRDSLHPERESWWRLLWRRGAPRI
jgi:hypothetical protein